MKNFIVTETENGMRLLRLVMLLTTGMPKSLLYKSFRNGRIKVNNKKEKENYRINTGETVSLYINDEFFVPEKKVLNPSFGFKVVYLDEHIALVDKKAGTLCHSDKSNDGNLLDGFIEQHGSGAFRPCLINRLDRGTQGLVIIARTHDAAEHLSSSMREGLIEKRYLAISTGAVNGVIKTGYSRSNNITTATEGNDMISEFKTLDSRGDYHLLEIILQTGKTHQIRSQLSSLGFHIVGDRKYSSSKTAVTGVKNQLLCAYELRFSKGLPTPLKGVCGRTFTAKSCCATDFFDSLIE